MLKKIQRHVLFTLLGLSYGYLSYYTFGQWWNSSVGSALIILFSYFIWRKEFLKNTGLNISVKTAVISIIMAGIVIAGAYHIMKHIASKNNILIVFTNWREYYHDIFYVLNEEIVIGAILLFAMVKSWKFRPFFASAGLAVVFAAIHFVLYKWQMRDRGIIEITTLTTLFFIGFVRNSLILQTGHIGYSWALHFGWVVVMLGSLHTYENTQQILTEPVRFNTYLGSTEMLIVSGILAILSLFVWMKKYVINYN